MDNLPINWGLMGAWENWVRLLLMVIIAGVAFDLIASPLLKKKDG